MCVVHKSMFIKTKLRISQKKFLEIREDSCKYNPQTPSDRIRHNTRPGVRSERVRDIFTFLSTMVSW